VLPGGALPFPSAGFPDLVEIGSGPAATGRIVRKDPTRVVVDLADLADLAATVAVSLPFGPAIAFARPVGVAHPAASVPAIAFVQLPAARASFPGGLATAAALLPGQGHGEAR